MAAQLPRPESDEQRCRTPADAGARHHDPESQRYRDCHCDGEGMTEGERSQRAPHRPPMTVLCT
jgi:hypothetical protein